MSVEKKTLDLKLISSNICEVIGEDKKIIGNAEVSLYNSGFGNVKITKLLDNKGKSQEYLKYPCNNDIHSVNKEFLEDFYKQNTILMQMWSKEAVEKLNEINLK